MVYAWTPPFYCFIFTFSNQGINCRKLKDTILSSIVFQDYSEIAQIPQAIYTRESQGGSREGVGMYIVCSYRTHVLAVCRILSAKCPFLKKVFILGFMDPLTWSSLLYPFPEQENLIVSFSQLTVAVLAPFSLLTQHSLVCVAAVNGH